MMNVIESIVTSEFGKQLVRQVKGDDAVCYVEVTSPNVTARFTSPSTIHLAIGNTGTVVHLKNISYPDDKPRYLRIINKL
jgi:hypothetical protein